MKNFEVLKDLVSSLEQDIQKVNDGQKAAGTRARKGLQEIKKVATALRTEIQAKKNEATATKKAAKKK